MGEGLKTLCASGYVFLAGRSVAMQVRETSPSHAEEVSRCLICVPPSESREYRCVGRESQGRRARRVKPAHRDGVVAGVRFGLKNDEAGCEPDAHGRPVRVVTVHCDLHHVADLDRDAGLLERLARRCLPDVLAPFDVAAGEAPEAGTALFRAALHQEYPSRGIVNHCCGPHAHVLKEHEPTVRAGGAW